ncbi:Hypothetical protein R9X50_00484300 [Acrodontium crateriforme]|uniref:DUF7719 domain-containing protein n=1 Tax=Acrodontium crateriforme TaxID=150365 RepID=A0AAQ3M619_9PEZI|nr:Hypothetical protein R9X50_00484300 [Acrodontium crateriforme]
MSETPHNRKERRAAAKKSGKPVEAPSSTPHIKLAHPDRSGPKGKTLLDLYEEKKSLLDHGQPFDPKYNDGQARDESGNILQAGLGVVEASSPLEQAVFWGLTLTMLHFTLDVLVYNQYRQEIEWSPIWKRSLTVLPVLFLMVFMMRSKTAERLGEATQVLYLAIAAATGCYTIHVSNKYDYFAVMKQAPPLGTLWIWSVIEMRLPFAAASAVVNLVYLWWNEYSVV